MRWGHNDPRIRPRAREAQLQVLLSPRDRSGRGRHQNDQSGDDQKASTDYADEAANGAASGRTRGERARAAMAALLDCAPLRWGGGVNSDAVPNRWAREIIPSRPIWATRPNPAMWPRTAFESWMRFRMAVKDHDALLLGALHTDETHCGTRERSLGISRVVLRRSSSSMATTSRTSG